MGDHFWPAVYPGLAVGLLYGLSLGGVRNIIVAALGGLAAAFFAFTFAAAFFAADGLVPLVALLAVSFAGSFAFVRIAAALVGGQPSPPGER